MLFYAALLGLLRAFLIMRFAASGVVIGEAHFMAPYRVSTVLLPRHLSVVTLIIVALSFDAARKPIDDGRHWAHRLQPNIST